MTEPSKLEIFILSYNRAHLIGDTLQSILNQSIQGFAITVLDNGSTDNTKEVVSHFKEIQFIGSEQNNGADWNFKRAITLASRDYVMLFHDDDLIHPRYIEYALELFESHPDASIVCSRTENLTHPTIEKWKPYVKKYKYFKNAGDFATYVYGGYGLSFASVIYKTDYLKKADIRFDLYGKICDRPFVYDAIGSGGALALTCPYIRYRIHEGQDCADSTNGPWFREFFALNLKYKELMSQRFSNRLSYFLLSYDYFRREYIILPERKTVSFKKYIDEAEKYGSLKKPHIIIGKIINVFGIYIARRVVIYVFRKIMCT